MIIEKLQQLEPVYFDENFEKSEHVSYISESVSSSKVFSTFHNNSNEVMKTKYEKPCLKSTTIKTQVSSHPQRNLKKSKLIVKSYMLN